MRFAKRAFLVVAFTLLGVLVNTPPCHAARADDTTSIDDVKRETQELLQTLKAYTADQRDEALRKTKAALDDLDTRIEALESRVDSRWDKMDNAAREKARANLKVLHEQRTRVAEWYGRLKSSSADAWQDVKKGFSDAYRALDEAWEKAEKDFESSE
jgi:chromosome segregation ATPase